MKKNVKIICCDNARKKDSRRKLRKKIEEINVVFTSPVTLQKNGIEEQGFDTRHYRMRVVMTHAVLYKNLKTNLWPECATTVTKPENIMVNPHKEKYAHENFYGKMRDYAKHLRKFGEMGVVCSIVDGKAKLYS